MNDGSFTLIAVCHLRSPNQGHDDTDDRSHPDVRRVVSVVGDPADGGGGGHDDQPQLEPEPQEEGVGGVESELEIDLRRVDQFVRRSRAVFLQ